MRLIHSRFITAMVSWYASIMGVDDRPQDARTLHLRRMRAIENSKPDANQPAMLSSASIPFDQQCRPYAATAVILSPWSPSSFTHTVGRLSQRTGEMLYRLAFRDYLRAHPEEGEACERLKRRLATEHRIATICQQLTCSPKRLRMIVSLRRRTIHLIAA